MANLFTQPYPTNNAFLPALRRALVIGLFIGLFLVVFQPFGLNNWETSNKLFKLLGFGAVTFVITAFHFAFWPKLFPRQFSEENWTVGREILFISVNVLVIAVANRFYLEWLLGPGENGGLGWIGMIVVTFLIGAFPITGLVLLSYIRRLRKYSQAAAELPVATPVHGVPTTESKLAMDGDKASDSTLTLVADNDKDRLIFPADELLYIESSDNYSTVVYRKNGQLVKPLVRSSLSRLEKQIAQPHIVRCHRSYVVNLNRVERVTGNAQGYKLHLMDGQIQLPVARQYNETLVAELKSL
ncbi:LytR/AlgR family response regulator transcription factor [Spirosoma validum]|uniref:LytTR family transcriptional regulator n=1 Tax=Spirosoma validum TaxID=2771355 RepID=A0A927GEH3_9BACT|nr:LytTR family DNA-binding domain-containing protein [Spirosoma validum]MBD2754615.1 LytTR family transcriptional regulator [Spirosoma validum]